MSQFKKLSHTIWHCQYHFAWTPKYRLRILEGELAIEVANCVRTFSEQKECEIIELNVQIDHVGSLYKAVQVRGYCHILLCKYLIFRYVLPEDMICNLLKLLTRSVL